MKLREFFKDLNIEAVLVEMMVDFPYTYASMNYYRTGYHNLLNIEDNKEDLTENIEISIHQTTVNDRPVTIKISNNGTYGILGGNWSEILSYHVDESLFNTYTKEYIASIFLIDILFLGNNIEQNKIEETKLVKSLNEAEDDIKNGRTYSLEEVMQSLKDKIGEVPKTPTIGEKYKNIHDRIFEVVIIGNDVNRDRTMIGLRDDKNHIIFYTMDDMFRDIDKITFSNGHHQKYLFEKVVVC